MVELDSQQNICRHRSHQPKAARRVALFSYVGAKESVEHNQHATVVSIQIFIPYEFGVKVSITTTHKEGLAIGMRSMPGNPYDGHTLAEALEQASILSEAKPEVAIVDRGYKGVAVDDVKIYHPGLRRGITRGLRAMIRRRSAIWPAIGHMKTDGKLDRNRLKGALGDAMHAVLCGAGHNLRMILRKLRLLCAFILAALINRSVAVTPSP
ncbi:IS5 family transposase [Paraburkholderia sp. CI2]|nr:IS5 family transposase [Paraburkholderia sp. CI2]